jgi:O-antigen/teichoic acid export membrane protein
MKNKNSNRAIKNTIFLYIRMVIVIFIGLYTTRLIFKALGEQDYGIYSLVAGVVAMFGFLNATMSGASTRFISYSIGKNESQEIKITFNTTFIVHLLIAFIMTIIIVIGGLLMFEYALNIPLERLEAAKIAFFCMVLSTCLMVITVPYDAMITAHEDFISIVVLDVLSAFVKLIIGIYLLHYKSDRLVLYAILILFVQVLIFFGKWIFARKQYKECRLNLTNNLSIKLIKEIFIFSGWNFFGVLCSIGSKQVSAIIINVFFGVRLNAATGLARRADDYLRGVSVNMTRALLPQLIKSEGAGNREKMLNITTISAKFSVFLYALVALPFIFEADYLLKLCLTTVPKYTTVFVQLFLLSALIEKFTFPLTDSFRAVGKIKIFQVTESLILLLNLPIAYCLYFFFQMPPQTIFFTDIIIRFLVMFERLYFAKKICDLSIKNYIKNVFVSAGIPVLLIVGLLFFLTNLMSPSLIRITLAFVALNVLHCFIFLFFGMTVDERKKIIGFLEEIFSKICKIRKIYKVL